MSKFVTFKNANPPYEGKMILINTDHIISVYEDLTANKKVAEELIVSEQYFKYCEKNI